MTDYSKMSDEELLALYNQQKNPYAKMSDEELLKAYELSKAPIPAAPVLQPAKEPSFAEKVVGGTKEAAKAVGKYGTAVAGGIMRTGADINVAAQDLMGIDTRRLKMRSDDLIEPLEEADKNIAGPMAGTGKTVGQMIGMAAGARGAGSIARIGPLKAKRQLAGYIGSGAAGGAAAATIGASEQEGSILDKRNIYDTAMQAGYGALFGVGGRAIQGALTKARTITQKKKFKENVAEDIKQNIMPSAGQGAATAKTPVAKSPDVAVRTALGRNNPVAARKASKRGREVEYSITRFKDSVNKELASGTKESAKKVLDEAEKAMNIPVKAKMSDDVIDSVHNIFGKEYKQKNTLNAALKRFQSKMNAPDATGTSIWKARKDFDADISKMPKKIRDRARLVVENTTKGVYKRHGLSEVYEGATKGYKHSQALESLDNVFKDIDKKDTVESIGKRLREWSNSPRVPKEVQKQARDFSKFLDRHIPDLSRHYRGKSGAIKSEMPELGLLLDQISKPTVAVMDTLKSTLFDTKTGLRFLKGLGYMKVGSKKARDMTAKFLGSVMTNSLLALQPEREQTND